ncbi:MAG: heavy-metal-associated domain-containing protein [Thermoflavifilum sp.]|nr:heavy-metal-associated domain-containing protein [Thermoflavifilum sp.]
MKTMILLSFVVAAGLFASPHACLDKLCAAPLAAKQQVCSFDPVDKYKAVIRITGIDCAACSKMIQQTLSKTKGVLSVDLAYPGNQAVVQFDRHQISDKQIVQLIEKLGYQAQCIQCEKLSSKF